MSELSNIRESLSELADEDNRLGDSVPKWLEQGLQENVTTGRGSVAPAGKGQNMECSEASC
jgi:hypothetical protein